MSSPRPRGERDRTLSLAAVGAALSAMVAIRTDTTAGMGLKFLLSKLVYSTSDGAILFLLAFAAICLMVPRRELPLPAQGAATRLFWGGAVAGYGAHLGATGLYFSEHRIPVAAHVYQWVDGVNSYSGVLHSHLGKAAMAPLAAWLPGASHYDAGNALADAVAPGLVWLIGSGFVATCIGALLWAPTLRARFGKRPALVMAWIIASATVTKSIFDGGLLAYAVLPSLLLLLSLSAHPAESGWHGFWRKRGIWLATLVGIGYLGLWIALTPRGQVPLLGPWLFYIAALAVLASWHAGGRGAVVGRVVLISYLAVNFAFDYGDNLRPLLRSPSHDDHFATFDAAGHWTPYESAGFGSQAIFQIYRALGDDPWKPRRTLVWTDTARGDGTLTASISVADLDGESGRLQPTPGLRVASVSVKDRQWIKASFAVADERLPPILAYGVGGAVSRNNYYVWLYQIDLLLRGAGWKRYILLPSTSGNIDG